MLVAIPTAIPEEPLTKRLGIFEGKTSGIVSVSSKLFTKFTVSFSRSVKSSWAILDILISV